MVITADQTFDSIGGGKLELNIIQLARKLIVNGKDQQVMEHIPLSVKAQQCCGGTVTVLLECFAGAGSDIAVFGAGHVGKALVSILGQLDARVRWIDNRAEQFPHQLPDNTTAVCRDDITAYVEHLPPECFVIILTHDHGLDYAILEACLDRKDCAYIGVIGSKTKALRFKKRLRGAAFRLDAIDAVACPIGLENIPGKQPIEVAVAISAQVIQRMHNSDSQPAKQTGIKWRELREAYFSQEAAEKGAEKKVNAIT